jgi:gamma-glutamyltranspeptidase
MLSRRDSPATEASAPARPTPTRPVAGRPAGDTVAIVAADGQGRWACLIQSVFHAFGAGLLDPGTGVLLHNRGAAFDLTPGSAGEPAGGLRPPHTLMPVLVRRAPAPEGSSGRTGRWADARNPRSTPTWRCT